ncbi:MAG: HEAT repeat domain-containing protein [Planctomycetota bacterium]|jgi:HEAT repeat protein
MRILVVLTLLCGIAAAQDPDETTYDRVYLRNGNFLDGKIVQETEEHWVLQVANGTLRLKKEMVDRIERITVREEGEEPEQREEEEKPPGTEKPPEGGTEEPGGGTGEGTEEGGLRDPFTKPTNLDDVNSDKVKLDEKRVAKIKDILARLESADANDQHDIMKELTKVGGSSASYLADIIDRLNEDLAVWVGEALILANKPECCRILRAKLDGKKPEIRIIVARVLAILNDKASLPKMISLARSDKDPNVRVAAVSAIGKLGEPENLKDLFSRMDDETEDVRRAASTAFLELAQRREAQQEATDLLLVELRGARGGQKAQVIRMLGNLKCREAIQDIHDLIWSTDSEVKAAAITALGKLGASDAVRDLMDLTSREKDNTIVIQICTALQRIGDRKAVRSLIDLMEERSDKGVRAACARALQTLTGEKFGPDPDEWRQWYEEAPWKAGEED